MIYSYQLLIPYNDLFEDLLVVSYEEVPVHLLIVLPSAEITLSSWLSVPASH